MNSKVLISIVAVVLIIGAGIFVATSDEEGETVDQATAAPEAATAAPSPENRNPDAEATGKYVAYSEDAVRSAEGTRLVFFHAPWCPQCRAIEEDIDEQGVPGGVTVFKADYDSSQSLRKKYGVTIQTTFVKVDAQGKQIEKVVAYDEPTFDFVKQALL